MREASCLLQLSTAFTLSQFFSLYFRLLSGSETVALKCSDVVKCLIRMPAEVATFWCGSACGHFTTNRRPDGPCPCVPVAWIQSASRFGLWR